MAAIQKPTNYEPTPAEMKLLKVLLEPESLEMTVTDICKQAGVSRDVYYTAFNKPEFVKYQREVAQTLLAQALLPTIHAFQKEAKKGSFSHGKVMLEMHDLYTEKQEVINKSVPVSELIDDDDPGTREDQKDT
jgi:hypothetical protein